MSFSGSVAIHRRARAALALRNLTVADLAGQCGVSRVHLRGVLLGTDKPSARLASAIRKRLGDAWPFVVGESPTLSVAP
jgi:transcriptional regulator with XRE-family HTH domain